MNEAIEVMRGAFIQLANGDAVVPQRIHTEMTEHNSLALFMPVYLPQKSLVGIKVVSVANDNSKKGLPLIHGLVLVIDASTGIPLAIMDGAYLTALRTGAGSGLATELLARKDSSTVAIFGAGKQGRTQLEAVCSVRNITKALIFDTNESQAQAYSKEMAEKLGIKISIPTDSSELQHADIICTATTSSKPVFDDRNISKGTHINGIGSYKLKMREIPADTVLRSKIIVDSTESCLAEAGDFLLNLDPNKKIEDLFHAELGQIAGRLKPGRESNEEITFFKSVGNAVQDLTAAARVYEKAETLDLGQTVEL
jgi:ornithine cyclodeaminase/alanine dehydrogenase-like protein (mu-crystallin family)